MASTPPPATLDWAAVAMLVAWGAMGVSAVAYLVY
jgi:hypothetical protein